MKAAWSGEKRVEYLVALKVVSLVMMMEVWKVLLWVECSVLMSVVVMVD